MGWLFYMPGGADVLPLDASTLPQAFWPLGSWFASGVGLSCVRVGVWVVALPCAVAVSMQQHQICLPVRHVIVSIY